MSKTWRVFFVHLLLTLIAPLAGAQTPAAAAEAPAATIGETPPAPTATPPPAPAPTAATMASSAVAMPEITNLSDLVKTLRLETFKGQTFKRKIKIAILDNGFKGYEADVGTFLRTDTEYHEGPDTGVPAADGYHGRVMAKLVSYVLEKSGTSADYELHLFNAFGYDKFADAVKNVREQKFDVVLYSQIWEWGGNGDGRGFINALINPALDEGIIWINAAGDFSGLTAIASVSNEMWQKETTFTCVKTALTQNCNTRLFLTWNDFQDNTTTGTDKDLDLIVYDSKGTEIAASRRFQKPAVDLSHDQNSVLSRELLEHTFEPGTYTIKVENRSRNFDPVKHVWRIIMSGPGLEIKGGVFDETIYPPADNPRLIVVGASDSPMTSKSTKLNRPDLLLRSITRFKDESVAFGSSNAAAQAAAIAAIHLGLGVEKNRDAILAALKPLNRPVEIPTPSVRTDGPVVVADRPAPRSDCIEGIALPDAHPAAIEFLSLGGAAAIPTTDRVVIAIDYDLAEVVDVRMWDDDQRPFVTPRGIEFVGEEELQDGLPRGYYEIVTARRPVCTGDARVSWSK